MDSQNVWTNARRCVWQKKKKKKKKDFNAKTREVKDEILNVNGVVTTTTQVQK